MIDTFKYVIQKFLSMNWKKYWFKFILKFPERFLVGVVSGLTVYGLLIIIGLM